MIVLSILIKLLFFVFKNKIFFGSSNMKINFWFFLLIYHALMVNEKDVKLLFIFQLIFSKYYIKIIITITTNLFQIKHDFLSK